MVEVNLFHGEGFKSVCFEGLEFPLTVKGTLINSGRMKGWLSVKGSEFIKQGCTSWLTDSDTEFEFSPDAFELT